MKGFNTLTAGGGTNGGDGIKMAYDIAEDNFIEDGVNRVIIMTDGDFNIGLQSKDELYNLHLIYASAHHDTFLQDDMPFLYYLHFFRQDKF